MRKRGLVLIHVMMMTLIVGYLCALILNLLMQPSLQGANVVNNVTQLMSAQSAAAKVTEAWAAAGASCASGVGVSCSGPSSGGPCDCVCAAPGMPSVTSRPGAGRSCVLSVTP